jgi:hypothetical protein
VERGGWRVESGGFRGSNVIIEGSAFEGFEVGTSGDDVEGVCALPGTS